MRSPFLLGFTLLVLAASIFGCSQRPQTLTKKDASILVEVVNKALSNQYFDKSKAPGLVAKIALLHRNRGLENISPVDAARLITDLLRKETNDKHFNVIAYPSIAPSEAVANTPKLSVAGISQYQVMKHNIGYIRWDACFAGEEAFKEWRKVLERLKDCRLLIFDLSDNPGGDGASSAFVNQFLYRNKSYQSLLQKKCTGERDWHQSEVIFDYNAGPSFFDKPIYIITSKKTFSAAEYFVLTAKEMNRAVILGDTTAGAGNPGSFFSFRVPDTDTIFWMFIPNCQIITRNGHSIEGVGVAPHILFKNTDYLQATLKYIRKEIVKSN